jgi:hypothetical protein
MTLVRQLICPATTLQTARRVVEQLLGLHRRSDVQAFECDGCIDPP